MAGSLAMLAAIVLTPKTEMSHEITLCEEEISDVRVLSRVADKANQSIVQ